MITFSHFSQRTTDEKSPFYIGSDEAASIVNAKPPNDKPLCVDPQGKKRQLNI